MLFNSWHFLLFFPIVIGIYFFSPKQWRWLWLLLASSYFYMAFIPAYVLVLYAIIFIDYLAALKIEKNEGRKRKLYLTLSIAANVGILFFFKYFNFFNANIGELAAFLKWNYGIQALNIILPIGLSFHTFQAMSYTIEVYKGNFKAERHLGVYALYVMFFSQLVAGPIERPHNLLPQLRDLEGFQYKKVVDGLKLMGWGFFKKVVIADRLAILVTQVYDKPSEVSGSALLLATYFFAFQIYCDFSGYTDIARGSARVMGVELMKNFERPYFSKSIAEFWRRWHISLNSWFRDYLYIPLGGNRVPRLRWFFNILAVFLISGLWHGANWTFVAWGGLLGLFMVASIITRGWRSRFINYFKLNSLPLLLKMWRVFITFNLISLSWILFRSKTMADAFIIVKKIFSDFTWKFWVSAQWSLPSLYVIFPVLTFLLVVQFFQRKRPIMESLAAKSAWWRWAAYIAVFWVIISLGEFASQEFIYFAF